MPAVNGVDKLLSITPKRRLGKHRFFGRGMFGYTDFGADDIIIDRGDGKEIILTGIFAIRHNGKKRENWRYPYYCGYNPRTEAQQANRQKVADGVLAWRALTIGQKKVYNQKAIGKHKSGYNVFFAEYLRTH